MNQILLFIIMGLSLNYMLPDIAPFPIVAKGIYTTDDCKIQMVSEYVFANLYNDSAQVECTFDLENFGEATEIQIGFPEMNFHYWSYSEYTPTDKGNFKIYVDGKLLTENDIQVPAQMDSIYQKFMSVYYYDQEYQRKMDSIYLANGLEENENKVIVMPVANEQVDKALRELFEWRNSKPQFGTELWAEFKDQKAKGNFPWYVWNVNFKEQETKQIKVVYALPSGLGYGKDYRYFKYILETGSGWYKSIGQADIKLQLHDIDMETIEEVSPNSYSIDSTQKTIAWAFKDLEPTAKDDIYVRYYNKKERQNWVEYKRNKMKKLRNRDN